MSRSRLVSLACVFMLATKLYGTAVGIVLGLLMLLPCIGLITLLIVNQKATSILKSHGIHVGLFGANTSPDLIRRAGGVSDWRDLCLTRPQANESSTAPALLWMGALIGLGILVMVFVCIPIREFLILRTTTTPTRRSRGKISGSCRMEAVEARRGMVVFSNGDRKTRDLAIHFIGICVVAPFAAAFIWLAYFTRPAKIYDDGTDTKVDTS